jgi:branched-chain amino acid transport system ATP-binding protein
MGALTLEHVTKKFGGLTAVNDLSIDLPEGSLCGLIGPNGAGKTTVFNLITGIYVPTSGSIKLNGKEINGMKPNAICKLGCSRTFQNLRLFKRLTALDNVCVSAQLHSADYTFLDAILRTKRFYFQEKKVRDEAAELLDTVGLGSKMLETCKNFPYGHQRKLEIARALATHPKVLLLDEPAAGMNPEESIELMYLIQDLRKKFNLTILLIEHHMELVMGICEHIRVLNFGATIADGSPEAIQNDRAVVEAYLGDEQGEQ